MRSRSLRSARPLPGCKGPRNHWHNNIGIKKPHRYRPVTLAFRPIRKSQHSIHLLIRKLPFERLVCEISQNMAADLPLLYISVEAVQQPSTNACRLHKIFNWHVEFLKTVNLYRLCCILIIFSLYCYIE